MADLTFVGTFNYYDGYGHASGQILKALKKLGANVKAIPLHKLPKEAVSIPGIVMMWATPPDYRRVKADELWGYTYWESSRAPLEWVEAINEHTTRLFTASQWCADMFRNSGVVIPIRVISHGVNYREYPYVKRPVGRRPYTFLLLGELGGFRKGLPYAYLAFWEAFKGSQNVRLVLKSRGAKANQAPEVGDDNVEIIYGNYSLNQMRKLYERADCFVFPSRGEGFGLPPREAASTGLPVIATDWSGLTEGGIENYAYPLRVKRMQTALYGPPEIHGQVGEWAEPDVDHLATLMSLCYENQAMARQKGKAASEWIGKHCRWDTGAQALLEAINGRL